MDINLEQYYMHWDTKFSSGSWGKYPPEELVRFIGRSFKNINVRDKKILEVGCGPGANLWFLHREGFQVAGIDGSPNAVEQSKNRLLTENKHLNSMEPDIRVGNFSSLAWEDNSFDVVIDVFSVYANPIEIIKKTLEEVHRVLKPGGAFFCKLWGTNTTGYGTGTQIEKNTFDSISTGPCANMGVTHFFDINEIKKVYSMFKLVSIESLQRTNHSTEIEIEEIVCLFKKSQDE